MTPAQFRVTREFLGLTGDWLAHHLNVSARTVRHWEQGRYAIPAGVEAELLVLRERTSAFVEAVVKELADVDPSYVLVFRDDEEYRRFHPDAHLPASWHRVAIARVAEEIPGLVITYPAREETDP